MTEEIYKNIYRIEVKLPNSPLKTLNAYLIRGTDGDYLIDTGYRVDECIECLNEGLEELYCSRDKLNVILTHMHTDHSGLFDVVCGSKGHIFLSTIDHDYGKRYIKGELPKLTLKRMKESGIHDCEVLSEDSPEALTGDFNDSRFVDLSDNDLIDTGEYKLKAILTPGHTAGHMVFFIEAEGVLFSGDDVLYDITPNITVFPYIQNSLKDYLSSLNMLKKLNVKYAFPSHRSANGDYYERITQLQDHHKRRLEEVYSIIINNTGSSPYEIASRMKWKIRHSNWNDFPNTQKWFALGECNAHLDYLEKDGLINYNIVDGIRRYYALETSRDK